MTRPLLPVALLSATAIGLAGLDLTVLAGTAHAQSLAPANPGIGYGSGLLPATGFGNGSLSSIRDFVDTPLTAGDTRTFTFDNSIGADVGYTDNVQGTTSGTTGQKPKGSFEARLMPTLGLNAQGRRVQVNLVYDPTLYYYPSVDSQSRIDQNLNASALAELFPQTAYLDLRAFATQTSQSNISGPTGTTVLSRQDLVQIYNFSANPYLQHQFGTFGTGRIGYTIANTSFNAGSNTNQTGNLNSIFGSGNSRTITQTEDAVFSTGEDFGRFNHTVELLGTQYSGTGSLLNGHRNLATYDIAYAFNRFVTISAEAGYEDLFYNGTTTNGVQTSLPYKLSEPIGNVGIKLTPNPDSSLSVKYGHIDGGQSVTVDATYKPTARTVFYATSSSGLTTNAQQVQNYVSGSQLLPNGVTVDPRTGAPVQYSNSSVANQNRLYRLTQTSLSGVLLLNRDTVTASLNIQQRSNPSGTNSVGVAGSSTYGSLAWQHDLSETVKTNVTFSYGVDETPQAITATTTRTLSNPTMAVTAGMTKTFTEKLSGTANYTFLKRDSSDSTQRVTVNEFLVGLLQRF